MAAEEEPSGFPAEEPQEEVDPELDFLRDRIQEVRQLDQRVGLPSLSLYNRAKVRAEAGKVNRAIKRIQIHNINELNSLLFASA